MLVVLAALLGGYAGYRLTSMHYLSRDAVQMKKELLNQEIHRRTVESMLRKQEELEQLVDDLSKQADTDPDAGRFAFGRDSVRRINRVH